MARRHQGQRGYWLVAVWAGWVSAMVLGAGSLRAGALEDLDVSLKWIPADAAFYGAMLRNREQIEIIGKSKAWAKLMELPAVQEGFRKFEEAAGDPDHPASKVQAGLNNPAVQDLLAFLADVFGRDVFLYAGPKTLDLLDLLQKLNSVQRSGQLFSQLAQKPGDLNENQVQLRLLIHMLAENRSLVRVPELIAGFRVEDKQRAQENLDKVMGLAMLAALSAPELKDCCKRTKVGGVEYVTIALNGEMIPWDQVPLDDVRAIEMAKGDVDKLVETIKKLKLLIALGLREDYLLISVGDSTEALARLGTGKRLIERPELKPLAAYAGKRLASIGYVSRELAGRAATSKEDLDEIVKAIEPLLEESPLTAEQKTQIRKDAAALAEDLKRLIPQPGAQTSFSFLTEEGIESFSYQWTKPEGLDGSKALSLLEHTGGSPLVAAVARGKGTAANYELLVKWLKVAHRYFEQYALPEMSSDEQQQYTKLAEQLRPLVKQLDDVTRQKLIPSLADGQGGLVLEAKIKAQRIARDVPPLDKPMPLPEIALVLGLSNADLFTQAIEQYRQIANGMIGALHSIEPDDVPDFEIPAPKTTKTKAGTIYQYPLPEEAGVDKQVGPTVGVAASVAVVSCSRGQPQRLLATKPVAVGGALADPKRPRATAFLLQWATLVETAKPWVEMVAQQILKEKHVDAEQADEILKQVHTVLDVLKVFQTLTAEAYFQDGALVNHSVLAIRDVK